MRSQLTLGILKPSLVSSQVDTQEVMRIIKGTGLEIVRTRKLFWKQADAEQFYGEHKGRFYFPRLVQHAVSGPSTFLALYGPDALQKWRDLIGPTHFYKTQWTQPETLRSRYGLSDTRNGFHGSDSDASAKKEINQIFEDWDIEWYLKHRESGASS